MKRYVNFLAVPLVSAFAFGSTAAEASGFMLGAGVGVPYGGLVGARLGVEIDLGDYVTLLPSAGVGWAVKGSGSDVGGQLLFGRNDGLFRFGIGVWRGTNAFLVDSDNEVLATGRGTTIGLSPRFQFGSERRHVLDVFLLSVRDTTYDCPARTTCKEDKPSGDIGVGYSYRFY